MRFLALVLVAAASLSFVNLTAEPARAVGLCTYDDTYNNMGGPGSECEGVLCMGYNSQSGWQTCIPPPIQCVTEPCPGAATAMAGSQVALCVIGDAYNTGGSRCEGVVCVGYNSQWGWTDCYPELGPCWPTCPPPPKRVL